MSLQEGGAFHVRGPLLYDTTTQVNGWMPSALEREEVVDHFLKNTAQLSGVLSRENAIKYGLACEYVFGAHNALWLGHPPDVYTFLLAAAQSFDLHWSTPRDQTMYPFSVSVTGSILSSMRKTQFMSLPYGGLGEIAES